MLFRSIRRENTYNSNSQAEILNHSALEMSYGAQPPFKRTYSGYPSVGNQSAMATPFSMMNSSSIAGHHTNLMSPPAVLASNAGPAYPIDNSNLYDGNPTYPTSSSTYQGHTTAQYSPTSYSNIYSYSYDSNIPR